MKENRDVKKPSSAPSGQINLPGNESLCHYGRISSATSQNQARPKRHKALWQRYTGGCEPEVSVPTTNAGGPQAKVSDIKRSDNERLRLIVSELSGTWNKQAQKRGFTRVLVALKRP